MHVVLLQFLEHLQRSILIGVVVHANGAPKRRERGTNSLSDSTCCTCYECDLSVQRSLLRIFRRHVVVVVLCCWMVRGVNVGIGRRIRTRRIMCERPASRCHDCTCWLCSTLLWYAVAALEWAAGVAGGSFPALPSIPRWLPAGVACITYALGKPVIDHIPKID